MNNPKLDLPRLLYIGDVPVEPSVAGAMLVYRWLQGYPAEKLRIITAPWIPSPEAHRLPGVIYRELRFGFRRLQYTRYAQAHAAFKAWLCTSAMLVSRVSPLLEGFEPDAVVTVTHGYSWLAAAQFAKHHQLPLHLILHDEWDLMRHSSARVRRWAGERFGECYQYAVSRLCVSPFMEELYRSRHGVPGTVLYPSRGMDVQEFVTAPGRLRDAEHPLVCGYAGSINSPGYVRALSSLAEALSQNGGTLLVYGPMSEEAGVTAGLTQRNIRWGGMIPSNQLIERLRAEVDMLFVPMSFDAQDRLNMGVGFPGKLADYTTAGLPLIIHAPPYASAMRWAQENPGVAEMVTTQSPAELMKALTRLASPAHRLALAEAAIRQGNYYFSAERAQGIFFDHLIAGPSIIGKRL